MGSEINIDVRFNKVFGWSGWLPLWGYTYVSVRSGKAVKFNGI